MFISSKFFDLFNAFKMLCPLSRILKFKIAPDPQFEPFAFVIQAYVLTTTPRLHSFDAYSAKEANSNS